MSRRTLLTAACTLLAPLAFAQTPAATPTATPSDAAIAKWVAANGQLLLESIQNSQDLAMQARISQLITANTPVKGPANAPVTIIEFGDYQCPACSAAQPALAAIEKTYGNRVRFAFKQLPLDFHPMAEPAAKAALAAGKQGKYWPYHDRLWQQQGNLNDAALTQIAKDLKLDRKRFDADRASPAIAAVVKQDLADARQIGARGTPFFLVNGRPLSGAQPEAAFAEVINAALAKTAPAKPR